jgi:hypothetical protein
MLTYDRVQGLYVLCSGRPATPAFLIGMPGEGREVRDAIVAQVHARLQEDHPATKLWSVEGDSAAVAVEFNTDAPGGWLREVCRAQARGLLVLHDLRAIEPEMRARIRELGHKRASGGHVLGPHVAVIFAATSREGLS